jgi:hypothetical protein
VAVRSDEHHADVHLPARGRVAALAGYEAQGRLPEEGVSGQTSTFLDYQYRFFIGIPNGYDEYLVGTRGLYRNLRKTLFNVVSGLRQVGKVNEIHVQECGNAMDDKAG